ncbi:hypothetical protein [Mesorhizobium sp. CAU 1741]|uniref:hypothetical protein n=1 Tax=Mesorhizobium sp. CAU 1741 TaxID=3140366 RepID=UPI00325B78E2
MTTGTVIQEVGEALYGPRWQSELARELKMSDRHMRRLASGEASLTPGMVDDIIALGQKRLASLHAAIRRLEVFEHPDG